MHLDQASAPLAAAPATATTMLTSMPIFETVGVGLASCSAVHTAAEPAETAVTAEPAGMRPKVSGGVASNMGPLAVVRSSSLI